MTVTTILSRVSPIAKSEVERDARQIEMTKDLFSGDGRDSHFSTKFLRFNNAFPAIAVVEIAIRFMISDPQSDLGPSKK